MADRCEAAPVTPEFSRLIKVDSVTERERVERIEATESERRALAERFDLEAIDSLTATVRLKRVRAGQMVGIDGTLEAEVVQTCVTTLEPVPNVVKDHFTALFAPPELVPEEEDPDPDMEFSVESLLEDLPEAFQDGRIDIGELVAQHLSLALDPYPRAPGVEFVEHVEDDEPEVPPNPFAALARWKGSH